MWAVHTVTQTFNERNRTITKLVTPTALKKAREFFGCPNLNGVELENQGGQGTAGSHWEKRILDVRCNLQVGSAPVLTLLVCVCVCVARLHDWRGGLWRLRG